MSKEVSNLIPTNLLKIGYFCLDFKMSLTIVDFEGRRFIDSHINVILIRLLQ